MRHTKPLSPEKLDRLFGGRHTWQDLWEDNQPASMLIQRFAERLHELGYKYVHPQLIIDPATGRPQYFMVHATDHPSAVSLMR